MSGPLVAQLSAATERAEFHAPAQSIRAWRQGAAARLQSAGVGRLSDAFLIPAAKDQAWPGAFYARQVAVGWRSGRQLCYLRVAALPFDLLPHRPRTLERVGAFFSLGPGLTAAGELHAAVLLVQIEGAPAQVALMRSQIEPVVRVLAEVADEGERVNEQDWVAFTMAGFLREEPPALAWTARVTALTEKP